MYRSNNMKKPGIIDSRFSGIRELCFSVYCLLCQSRQRRVVFLRTANRAMPAAASSATATPYGAMAAPVLAVVAVVVPDWSPGSGCRNLNGGGLGTGYSANSLDRDGLASLAGLERVQQSQGTICLGSERLGYFSDLLDVGDDGIIVVHGDGSFGWNVPAGNVTVAVVPP